MALPLAGAMAHREQAVYDAEIALRQTTDVKDFELANERVFLCFRVTSMLACFFLSKTMRNWALTF